MNTSEIAYRNRRVAIGARYPRSAPCELQLVLTRNGREVGRTVKEQVPNESEGAVRLTFKSASPFPHVLLFDTDRSSGARTRGRSAPPHVGR